jgi:hypothetical protein
MNSTKNSRLAAIQTLQFPRPAPAVECACPGCHLPRLERLEELNLQLAQANDALRQERDELRQQLEREVA